MRKDVFSQINSEIPASRVQTTKEKDQVAVLAGIAFYESFENTSVVYPYKDQDRLFFRLKYSF